MMQLSEKRVTRMRAELVVQRIDRELNYLRHGLSTISRLKFIMTVGAAEPELSIEDLGAEYEAAREEDEARVKILERRRDSVWDRWLKEKS